MVAIRLLRLACLRAVLTCWRLVTLQQVNIVLKKRIMDMKEERPSTETTTSIWKMRKAALVEIAQQELQISKSQAEQQTVDLLRHLIKEHRAATTATATQSDLPKGLSRMSHKELIFQADARGINVHDPRHRHGVKVRQQLILDIKAYEAVKTGDPNMTPTDMEEDGFSQEFFMPPAGSSAAPTGPPTTSASGSAAAWDPSWLQPENPLGFLLEPQPTRR